MKSWLRLFLIFILASSEAAASAQEVVQEVVQEQAPEQKVEKFARNLELTSFVPKGQWIGGCSVSYSQSKQDNYQFFIIEGITGDTYSFKVSPMVYFAFKDNLAVGGRFGYTRSKTKLKSGSVILASDTKFDVENIYSISQNYSGSIAFRNYISFGKSKRFGVFNEVQVQIGGGQSKLIGGTGKDLTGTFETNFSLDIGLTPGLIMFLTNYSAIEVSIGVLGFKYSKTHSVTDQIYIADRNYKYANFHINLFSVSFGVAFYI